jgi:hypothetical protein
MWQFEQAAVAAAVVAVVVVVLPSTLGLFVDQHLLEPLSPALLSRRVATQAGGYEVVVEAAVRSTMVVAAPLRLQWQTLPVKRILPRALCQLVYITAVWAVLGVLAAQSRRLGVQPPHLLSPLERVRLAAANVVARDPPAFLLLLYCAPAFLCLPPVLVGLVVETLVLAVLRLAVVFLLVVVAAVMVMVLRLPVVFLLVVLPDLSLVVLLHQELRARVRPGPV